MLINRNICVEYFKLWIEILILRKLQSKYISTASHTSQQLNKHFTFDTYGKFRTLFCIRTERGRRVRGVWIINSLSFLHPQLGGDGFENQTFSTFYSCAPRGVVQKVESHFDSLRSFFLIFDISTNWAMLPMYEIVSIYLEIHQKTMHLRFQPNLFIWWRIFVSDFFTK